MTSWQSAHGKIILIGEHAVVYGQPAIAGAFPDAIKAQVTPSAMGVSIDIPQWNYRACLPPEGETDTLGAMLRLVVDRLRLHGQRFALALDARVKPGMGLGASASVAVATIRALDYYYTLGLSLSEINALAFECEKLAHGRPSGIDNTMACFGGLCRYRRVAGENVVNPLHTSEPLRLVVVMTPETGSTASMVAKVAKAAQAQAARYQALFEDIGQLSQHAEAAIQQADLALLGQLMTRNHEVLVDLGVSTPSLNNVVSQLCDAGALGAKLTGSGGGGAVIALCDHNSHDLAETMARRGNDVMEVQLGV